MKDKLHQNSSKTLGLTTLMLLMAVVLFSSCNFRKTIRAELGLAVTKPLNVSKATVNNFGFCDAGVDLDLQEQSTREHQTELELHLSPGNVWVGLPEVAAENNILPTSKSASAKEVPFYILYLNMKVFS
ncbi:hypothetical protein [Pedobacter immunditicola]|uniref:hypothetical protein n=1 Tax=Pedobacter immunditicola TaxID=3133440 RepID=UPI0030B32C6E